MSRNYDYEDDEDEDDDVHGDEEEDDLDEGEDEEDVDDERDRKRARGYGDTGRGRDISSRVDDAIEEDVEADDSFGQVKKLGGVQIPGSVTGLKACPSCLLIRESRKDEGCPNGCPEEATSAFTGLVALMNPSQSWVARNMNLAKDPTPGMYALKVFDTKGKGANDGEEDN